MEEREFKRLAKTHLVSLGAWFCGLLVSALIAFEIRAWADNSHGWQGDFVTGLFTLLGGLSGLGALIFGIFIYSWFGEYKVALSDSKHFSLDEMRKLRGGVIGPIRWR